MLTGATRHGEVRQGVEKKEGNAGMVMLTSAALGCVRIAGGEGGGVIVVLAFRWIYGETEVSLG